MVLAKKPAAKEGTLRFWLLQDPRTDREQSEHGTRVEHPRWRSPRMVVSTGGAVRGRRVRGPGGSLGMPSTGVVTPLLTSPTCGPSVYGQAAVACSGRLRVRGGAA
jgi:hypothetical protein